MSKLLKKEKGFTLIEVVIVLAIAALIILVVLQAVTSAQKSNRDTARKSEAGRVVSLLEQYASNNNGIYPTNAQFSAAAAPTSFLSNYDLTLYNKYQGAGATTSGAGLLTGAGATCTVPVTSKDYTLLYNQVSPRTYTLSTCLENVNVTTGTAVQH